MNLWLTRTAEAKGLIYEATDVAGKVALAVEREVCDFSVWTLYFRSGSRSTQAVMSKDSMSTEYQAEDGQLRGRLREARFSIAGKVFVEDEKERRLGSVSFGLAKAYLKDNNGRRIGLARQTISKKKFGFIPPSKAHTFWNYEVEIEDAAYDERFLFALVCALVTSEFASSGGG